MDADFSHDPRYLGALLAAASDADLVLGSRYVPGGGVSDWGPLRRLISRGGGVYARLILRVEVHDLTGGFKCIRREVLEAIDLRSVRAEGYVFQIEVTYRALLAGFRVVEVPIVFQDRTAGTSKMSARIALEAMWLVPRLRRSAAAAVAPRRAPGERSVRAGRPDPNVIPIMAKPHPTGARAFCNPMSVRGPLGATPQSGAFELKSSAVEIPGRRVSRVAVRAWSESPGCSLGGLVISISRGQHGPAAARVGAADPGSARRAVRRRRHRHRLWRRDPSCWR